MTNPYPVYHHLPPHQNMNIRNQTNFVSPNTNHQYYPSPVKPQSISFLNRAQEPLPKQPHPPQPKPQY